jgi:hypothetical protein
MWDIAKVWQVESRRSQKLVPKLLEDISLKITVARLFLALFRGGLIIAIFMALAKGCPLTGRSIRNSLYCVQLKPMIVSNLARFSTPSEWLSLSAMIVEAGAHST